MRRIRIVLFLFIFLFSSVSAGDEDQWRLVQPTVDEYLERLEPITQAFTKEYFGPLTAWGVLEAELDWRYADALDYETLERAYRVLNKGYRHTVYYSALLNLPAWNMRIVSSWLQAHPVDFSQYDAFIFDPYVLHMKDDFDFDGDGSNDLLVAVDRGTFIDYWLAFADSEQLSGYRFKRVPFPYQEANYTVDQAEYLRRSSYSVVWDFWIDDINTDGKYEFVDSNDVPLPGSNYTGISSSMQLVGWGQDGFYSLIAEYQEVDGKQVLRPISVGADDAGKPHSPTPWKFENIDQDEARELIVTEGLKDNFGCLFTDKKIYDWDGQYYMLAEAESGFDETFYCAVRQAEEAVIENADYVTAIPYYELAIERFDQYPFATEDDIQLIAYAQERLALAYAMTDRLDEARRLLENMGDQPDDTIAAQLLKTPAQDFTPLNVCRTTFDFLEKNFSRESGNYAYHNLPFIGEIKGWFDLLLPTGNPVNPATVGCDYSRVLKQQLSNLSLEQPLIPQIEALEIGVANEFHADLNSDGLDDWLVWFDTSIDPAVFITLSDEDRYKVQFTEVVWSTAVEQPSARNTLSIQSLPDASSVLVELEYYEQDGDNLDFGPKCVIDSTELASVGRLRLWHLVDNKFTFLEGIPLCERRSLAELFSEPGVIDAWEEVKIKDDPGNNTQYLPAIYRWDEAKNNYVGSNTPSEEEIEQVEDVSSTLGQLHNTTQTAFAEADFQQVLTLTDELEGIVLPDEDFNYELAETYYALRYYRAMALEALDRPEDALAEYVSIYDAMPDSAWGMLAALHFEKS